LFKELITSPTVKRKEANLKTEIADLEEQNAPEETIEKKKENLFRYQIKNSDNLIVKELLSDEGYRTNVYEDTEGYLTVGIGHKLTEQEKEIYKKGDYVASDIIKKWTTNDITKFSNIAEEGMTEMNLLNSDIYQNHKEKWVSFFYQLGKDGGLKFENMFDAIRQGNGQAAHDEALNSLWAKQTPKRAKRFAKFLKENV